jgi:hypothetical protein
MDNLSVNGDVTALLTEFNSSLEGWKGQNVCLFIESHFSLLLVWPLCHEIDVQIAALLFIDGHTVDHVILEIPVLVLPGLKYLFYLALNEYLVYVVKRLLELIFMIPPLQQEGRMLGLAVPIEDLLGRASLIMFVLCRSVASSEILE